MINTPVAEAFDAAVFLHISKNDRVIFANTKRKDDVEGVVLRVAMKFKFAILYRAKTDDGGHTIDEINHEAEKAMKSLNTRFCDHKLFVFNPLHYEDVDIQNLNAREC